MVASSKAQEERDGGRLSAGGKMPVIADGDGEQERELRAHSAGREVPTAVALENEKEKVYSQLRGKYL